VDGNIQTQEGAKVAIKYSSKPEKAEEWLKKADGRR
jgi:hypothetical protein